MSTFFRNKEARLKKKSNFETTGSNAVTEKEIDDLTDAEKFDELLFNLKAAEIKSSQGVDKVEEALQRLLDMDWGEADIDETSAPIYILDVKGKFKWLYSVQRRTYVPVQAGVEVVPVTTDLSGYFCVINNELFSLEEEWVSCVGWN